MLPSFKEIDKMTGVIHTNFESNFINRLGRILKKFFGIRKSNINEVFINISTYIFLEFLSNMIFITIIGYRKVV